jgi:rare lipoprotein A
MRSMTILRLTGAMAICTGLMACQMSPGDGLSTRTATPNSLQMVDRDVEAPQVFEAEEAGYWDGKASQGGIWVAHPDVRSPERVIIRNTTNDRFVIGSLFQRDANGGPNLQLSSDAANALGVWSGQAVPLSVVALRKEQIADPDMAPGLPRPAQDLRVAALDTPPAQAAQVQTGQMRAMKVQKGGQVNIDDLKVVSVPTPGTAQATQKRRITAAPAAPVRPVRTAALPTPDAAPAPTRLTIPAPAQTSRLGKPFVQIGYYSVEANAKGTGERLRKQGIVPIIRKETARGKSYWRVVVGPMANIAERGAMQSKVKSLGFTDAYYVSQ